MAEYHGMEIHSKTLAARNVIAHLSDAQVVVRENMILNESELYYSRLTTATKFQSTDRMCFDLTSAIGGGMSLNDNIDEISHLIKYPRDILPTRSKICEFLCDTRNRFPVCGHLDGSTVDIRTAYNQYTYNLNEIT
jgi:hypothetical protein